MHTAHVPIPAGLLAAPVADQYAPILALLRDTLLTADEVATRWRMSTQTLANLRRSRRSLPYLKIPPSGAVRYRLSDVVAAELGGMRGPVTAAVVALALSGIAGVSPQTRDTVLRRIEALIAAEPRG